MMEYIGFKVLQYRETKQKGDGKGNKYVKNIDTIKDELILMLTTDCKKMFL